MTRVGGPPPGVVPSGPAQGAPVTVVLSDLPAGLRNLSLGAFLTGTVLERTSSGMTMLQTGAGVFGIKANATLPPGSTVTLQIQSAGAQIQAIVLSVTPQGAAKTPLPQLMHPVGAQPASHAAAMASNAATALPIVDRPATAATAITATVIGPAGGPAPATPPTSVPPGPQMSAGSTATAPAANAAPGNAPPANGAPLLPAAPVANAAQTAVYQRQMSIAPNTGPAPSPSSPIQPSQAATAQTQATPAAQPAAAGAPAAATAKPLVPLPSGTQIQIRLLPTEPGATAAAPTGTAPPASAAATAATTARATATTATPQPHNLVTSPASNAAATQHAAIAGTVVARTPAGQTILDTPVGRILAALPRTMDQAAPGTRIALELLTAAAGATLPRPGIFASGPSAIAREWPGLRDLLKLLQGAPAEEIRPVLEHALPKPGPRLAQQMLAFVEAATQGGARAWLGESVARIIERLGGRELLGRLDTDLRDMLGTQRSAEGDWRMTIVPLLDGRELRQIRFFERRKKRDEKDKRREDSARFVVECDHSELGALQLDGLMHEKRLDVILRSHEKLPQEMERDILALFGNACTGLGLSGQLLFQAVPVFPVSPLDDFSGNAVQVSI